MKLYILQQNYTEVDPEAYWDEESGGYEAEEYECRDVIGVYPTLKAAVNVLVKEKIDSGRNYSCWQMHEVDTDALKSDGSYTMRQVEYTEYKKLYDELEWGLTKGRCWKESDFERADKEFENKDWFAPCCKDCKFKKMKFRDVFTHCAVLYEQKKAETNCCRVKDWIKNHRK